jgi:hypothetical protein
VCADEESTKNCVAVGFFFARRIQQDVRVPIGLLNAAWAGSIIQEWIPPHAWRLEPELRQLADRVEANYPDMPYGRKVWKKRLEEIDVWMLKADQAITSFTVYGTGSAWPITCPPCVKRPRDSGVKLKD